MQPLQAGSSSGPSLQKIESVPIQEFSDQPVLEPLSHVQAEISTNKKQRDEIIELAIKNVENLQKKEKNLLEIRKTSSVASLLAIGIGAIAAAAVGLIIVGCPPILAVAVPLIILGAILNNVKISEISAAFHEAKQELNEANVSKLTIWSAIVKGAATSVVLVPYLCTQAIGHLGVWVALNASMSSKDKKEEVHARTTEFVNHLYEAVLPFLKEREDFGNLRDCIGDDGVFRF